MDTCLDPAYVTEDLYPWAATHETIPPCAQGRKSII